MSLTDSSEMSKPMSALKSLVIEAGIVLVLASFVLIVLNFFKVIDIGALISTRPNSSKVMVNNQGGTVVNYKTRNNPLIQRLQYLAANKALHFEQLLSEFEGKVKSIDTVEGIDPNSNLKYKLRITLHIGTGSATTTVVYPEEAMTKIKITDSNKNAISSKDLHIGDTLIIRNNVSNLRQYPNYFNDVLIRKK